MSNKDLSAYNDTNALIFTTPEEQVHNSLYQTLNTFITIRKDLFHSIFPNLYPKKELTNQIGAGMGIEFSSKVALDEVFGDLEEYPDGRKIRKVEGYRCIKHGRRRRPDGSWSPSSPGIYEFNWINRAELDFLVDEDKAENDRKYTFADKAKQARKRQHHIAELKKFAAQRASTGAELVVIRELTGMSTSFKAADIAKGVIIVSQIIESGKFQAKKAQAEIDNIRSGGLEANKIEDAAELLTGKKPDVVEDVKKNETKAAAEDAEIIEEEEKPPGLKEQFKELKKVDGVEKITPSFDEYLKTVEENNYSDEVLTWAITEIMTQIG